MTDNNLENLAYRLKDLNSLRNLFSELNFDFADKPVNKDHWNNEQKEIVVEARIIASKNDYQIYYIQTNTDSLRQWQGIATKIIKDNHGFCMICSHNPSGFKWIFSSLSKEFSKSFSETRHVPIDIKPDVGVPKTFVDFLEKIRIKEESTASSIISKISDAFDSFAIQIHDELTVNVFEALKILSEGIILDKSNNLILDEKTLEEIREPTFILLYRIMFVLYAEDRSVFPEDKFYHNNFSLKWLKTNGILKPSEDKEYHVHKRLQKLFRLIEMGSEDLGYDPGEFFMRSYYGRLFDRKIHSQLESWKIPNKNLLDALGLLTRTRDRKGNYFFLDYAALETRHLGAIYEHLLEYHLTVKDGKITDLPNPKGRKSTGSYYTPQYVVDYIVENSIGPLIDDIIKKTNDSGEQIDEILALNVLDPAMGSGHFLIGATNYIAKRICGIEYKEEITEQMYVERKRDVVRRCIYGVDINPLAVDLASVSLWLETLSSEKPLSFLNAHLKSGNSLIGSSIDDILDKQTTLMESTKGRTRFKKTVRDFIMLEMLEDDTAEAVKTKTVKYNTMQSQGTVYYDLKFLLDAKLAKSFNVDVPPIGDFVQKIGENSLDFYSDERWQQIRKISEKHLFFHWDLEFPDIFYDSSGKRKKDPGFDAVVGNPPYIRVQKLVKIQSDYFKENYETSVKTYDIYAMFIECGFKLLTKNGFLCFILPHKFFSGNTGENLRKYIDVNKSINQIIHFGTNQIFKEVTTYTCIIKLVKRNNFQFYYKEFKRGDDFKNLTNLTFRTIQYDTLNDGTNWNFSPPDIQNILKKIKKQEHVFEYITDKIFKGSSTGDDKIFVLEKSDSNHTYKKIEDMFSKASSKTVKIESELLHPFVHGEDVRQYLPRQTNKMLLFPYQKTANDMWKLISIEHLKSKYPNTFRYLNSHKNKLLARAERPKRSTFYKYSASRSISEYQQKKIMIPDMLVSNRIAIDKDGIFYHNANVHSVIFNQNIKDTNPYFYLGILNSSLFWFFIKNTSTSLRGDAYRLTPQFLNRFTFPSITEKNKKDHDKIVENVKKIIDLKNNLYIKVTNENKIEINKQINKNEKIINIIIYKLYLLEIHEIQILENSSNIDN